MSLSRFTKYTISVIVFNLLVILWGSYVRQTGSGDGCGSHWPLCNGEVIPLAPNTKMIIEFTHRLSSGLVLLMVVGLVFYAFRAFPKGHLARKAAVGALAFTFVSALIGAGLVLFHLVGSNDSMVRGGVLAAHLINTMLLLGSLTLAAWAGSGGRKLSFKGHGLAGWLVAIGAFAVLLVGMSGAITSLGDTLYPRNSSAQVILEGLSPAGNLLIRLRLWHPFIATGVGVYLFFMAALLGDMRPDPGVARALKFVVAMVILQIAVGVVNVWYKAPMTISLIHLFLADALWIAMVLSGVSALTSSARKASQQDGRLQTAE